MNFLDLLMTSRNTLETSLSGEVAIGKLGLAGVAGRLQSGELVA